LLRRITRANSPSPFWRRLANEVGRHRRLKEGFRMPKAIIFDVDGTLIDSNDLHTAAWVEAFKRLHLEVRREAIRHPMGMGSDQLLEALFPDNQLANCEKELREVRAKIFTRHFQPQCRAFPKVRVL
jgi:phosphoglycolate phosphatase-like HAD superfamily hydrolase